MSADTFYEILPHGYGDGAAEDPPIPRNTTDAELAEAEAVRNEMWEAAFEALLNRHDLGKICPRPPKDILEKAYDAIEPALNALEEARRAYDLAERNS